MINNFWTWISQSINNALSILNTMYNNTTLKPFFDLLLVVLALGAVIKFILSPLLGISIVTASDEVKNSKKEEAKNSKNKNNTNTGVKK